MLVSAGLRALIKVGGEFDGRNHAAVLGDALPCDVEGCAVVYRSAQERQAERDVDCFTERHALNRNESLIVITRKHNVEFAA